ncbi:hypothetical protein ABEX28_09070 [Bacillus tropicus]|uniref:hypothetical protein n=1 Tax=Bacillus tropicus TaxID=2026188 RepID=UPI003D2356CA
MEKTILFDFSKYRKAVDSLCEYLDIEEEFIYKYLTPEIREQSVDDFLAALNMPEERLLEADLLLTALHVTTSNDKCASIKKFGLLNLQNAIKYDTSLSRYLKKHSIDIDFVKKEIQYNNKVYDIGKNLLERSVSDDDETRALYNVIEKLFADHQINAFFSRDNVLRYGGSVNSRPEFLEDLRYLLDNHEIENDWKYNCQKNCYVIKFFEQPSAFSNDTFWIKEDEAQRLNAKELEIKRRKWIVKRTLEVIHEYYFYRSLPENFAFLKPGNEVQTSNFLNIYTENEYIKEYVTV